MHFLAITLAIFGGIAALVVIILLLPVHVIVKINNDTPELYWRLLFIDGRKIKEKPDKEKNKTVKKLIGVDSESIKAGVSLADTLESVKLLIKHALCALKKCRIKKMKIHCAFGGDCADAAITYGLASATVNPFIGFVNSLEAPDKNAVDVDLKCDFTANETVYDVVLDISVKIVTVLAALYGFTKEKVENNLK